jgi:hypothetical protein
LTTNNNPYSKYRFSNNYKIKVRADANGRIVDVFGADLQSPVNNVRAQLMGQMAPPYGTKVIVNGIYEVERVSDVDTLITPPTYKGPTVFKLFRLK